MKKRLALMLFVATGIAMSPVLASGFLTLDDPVFIEGNSIAKAPTAAGVIDVFTTGHSGLYFPIPMLAWGVLAQASEKEPGRAFAPIGVDAFPNQRYDPRVFHAASLLVHAISTLAVFFILARFRMRAAIAALGALFFGLHPMQVETVAWVSLLKDLLGGMFSLLAIAAFLVSSAARVSGQPRRASYIFIVATVLYLFALLSKPSAIAAPVLAFLCAQLSSPRPLRQQLTSIWPWSIPAAIVMLISWRLQLDVDQPVAIIGAASDISLRPAIAVDALSFYLKQIVFPVDLSFDYGRSPRAAEQLGFSVVPLGIFLTLIVVARVRASWAVPCGLMFVAALLPVLGLVPFQFQYMSTVTDHYAYLALFPAAAAFAFGTQTFVDKYAGARTAALAAVAAVVVLLGARAYVQAMTWRSSVSTYEHAIAVSPHAWFARRMLGDVYVKTGDYERAARHLRDSTTISGVPYGLYPVAEHFLTTQQYAKALDVFEALLRASPTNVRGLIGKASALAGLGRVDEADAFLAHVLANGTLSDRARTIIEEARADLRIP